MTDEEGSSPPVVVPPSATSAQVSSGMRDFLLLVGVLPALVAVLGTRDVVYIINWLASSPGLTFLGLLVTVATPIWRQLIARRQWAREVTLADKLPDQDAFVDRKEKL